MTDTFKLVTDTLLVPAGLETSDIDRLMGRLLSQDIDYADLYFQYSRQEGWALEDGAVKSGSRSTDQGVGLRLLAARKLVLPTQTNLYCRRLPRRRMLRGPLRKAAARPRRCNGVTQSRHRCIPRPTPFRV